MRPRELFAAFRRPWSKPLLVLVTALIAGIAGYAVAAIRPSDMTSPESPPVVLGDWIYETRENTHDRELIGLAQEALDAAPKGVRFARALTVSQDDNYVGYQLMALPAGSYRVYVNCRTAGLPVNREDARMALSIDFDGVHSAVNVACPSEATRSVLPLTITEDTVFALGISPANPDDGDLWSVSIAIGVLVEEV